MDRGRIRGRDQGRSAPRNGLQPAGRGNSRRLGGTTRAQARDLAGRHGDGRRENVIGGALGVDYQLEGSAARTRGDIGVRNLHRVLKFKHDS